jgi:nucleotide-binding universal stress UspA family protein
MLAAESNADLIVVGTHQRAGFTRLLHGSVAAGVLEQSVTNVLCVPYSDNDKTLNASVPEFKTVLTATDLSAVGDKAVRFAYGLLRQGGTLHLLHVTEQPSAEATIKRSLMRLVPRESKSLGIETLVHVQSERNVALAICHLAERLNVDAVCLGTHAKTGLGKLLGSHTSEVLRALKRPLLLVPPGRDD